MSNAENNVQCRTVVSRTVELVLGYRKSNQSSILKLLLSKLDELIARASNHIR
jgi:hypothetical protein